MQIFYKYIGHAEKACVTKYPSLELIPQITQNHVINFKKSESHGFRGGKMFSIIAISRFTQYSFIITSICISALIETVRGKPNNY